MNSRADLEIGEGLFFFSFSTLFWKQVTSYMSMIACNFENCKTHRKLKVLRRPIPEKTRDFCAIKNFCPNCEFCEKSQKTESLWNHVWVNLKKCSVLIALLWRFSSVTRNSVSVLCYSWKVKKLKEDNQVIWHCIF